jgi:UDP-N-acetylglucosamine 1-carboxyvinyltransferase
LAEWLLRGGRRVQGKVRVAGSKYSALAAIPAALLAEGETVIANAPDIRDTRDYCALLAQMGAQVVRQGCTIAIDPAGAAFQPVAPAWAEGLRASYYMVGAQLARWGRAEVGLPGGDRIGRRPIDLHVKVLRAMGADVDLDIPGRVIRARRSGRLQGATVYLDTPSVGATVQAMLCGVLAEGETRVENAYVAAFIVDLAELLNAMGADIRGAGTRLLRIRGVEALHGTRHALIGDQAEAFTYRAAAAATGGDVTVEGIEPEHLASGTAKLAEAGAEVSAGSGWVRVRGPERLQATDVTTGPLPAFYTDYQPPMAAALATAAGVSQVRETVWPERFGYVPGLTAMGAQIRTGPGYIVISGVRRLTGRRVVAGESRAAAAYVIAGLCADGTTCIAGTEHLERVYSGLREKLRGLGVDVEEVAPEAAAMAGSDGTQPLAAGAGEAMASDAASGDGAPPRAPRLRAAEARAD